MIVCVCNNVSEKKIQAAVNAGISSMSELRHQLDVGTCCGKCTRCARQVLHNCLENRDESQNGVELLFQRLHFQRDLVAA